jgi:hypothetical protein
VSQLQAGGHAHGHGQQVERQGLAVHVEIERVVDAAVEHLVEHEVHAGERRQQVAQHLRRLAVGEVLGDALRRDLLDQQRVVLGFVGEQADVGAIALVAGARMGDLAQHDIAVTGLCGVHCGSTKE